MWELGPVTLAFLGTLFTFLVTTLGAAVVFLFKKELDPGIEKAFLGFAAGVMVAASIWSMILPALEIEMTLPGWLIAGIGVACGAVFINIMDRILERVTQKKQDERSRTTLLFTAITLHNIPEGFAVGLAFALAAGSDNPVAMAGAIALMIGIGIQNFPEGAALSLPLHQEGHSKGKAFLIGSSSALVEPIAGVAAALLIGFIASLMPWMLTFAAGAMIYVVVQELIPAAQSKTYPYLGTLGFMIGFLIMLMLDVGLG